MTEDRERPQYGEYATPEQQRRAMGLPPVDEPQTSRVPVRPPTSTPASAPASASTPAPTPAPTPTPETRSGPDASPLVPGVQNDADPDAPALPRGGGGVRRDRLVTVTLLACGAITVATSIRGYLDFSSSIEQLDASLGVGKFGHAELADQTGIWLLVIEIVLYAASLLVALRLLRRGRISFYVPLLGALAFWIVSAIALWVLFQANPTVMSQIDGLLRGQ
jgi:hypothetical protein